VGSAPDGSPDRAALARGRPRTLRRLERRPRGDALLPAAVEQSDAFVDRIEARFTERGYGLWAVERREDGAFLGFTGLAYQTFEAPFTPCVEVGWRLARFAWGNGYATEAAREALRFGFVVARLPEIVSFTSPANAASVRVMERIGLHRDPADDFEHPNIPSGHPLRRHVLYRLRHEEFNP
jgi:RimJ/RimL family protein N-acetyltransferase